MIKKIGPRYIWVDDWDNKEHRIVVLWYNGIVDNLNFGFITYTNGSYYTESYPHGIIDETGMLPLQSKPTKFGSI